MLLTAIPQRATELWDLVFPLFRIASLSPYNALAAVPFQWRNLLLCICLIFNGAWRSRSRFCFMCLKTEAEQAFEKSCSFTNSMMYEVQKRRLRQYIANALKWSHGNFYTWQKRGQKWLRILNSVLTYLFLVLIEEGASRTSFFLTPS